MHEPGLFAKGYSITRLGSNNSDLRQIRIWKFLLQDSLWKMSAELRVLPLLVFLKKSEVKALVFQIWTFTLRGEMLGEVGVGTSHTQLARDKVSVSQCPWIQSVFGKTLYRAGGFSRNTICSQNKNIPEKVGKLHVKILLRFLNSDEMRGPAEFKHINKRRKRN